MAMLFRNYAQVLEKLMSVIIFNRKDVQRREDVPII